MNLVVLLGVLGLVALLGHIVAAWALRVRGVRFLTRRLDAEAVRSSRVRRLGVYAAGPLVAYAATALMYLLSLAYATRLTADVRPVPDSPASRAGLKEGDRVVTAAGRPIDDFDDLVASVAEAHGAPVTLGLLRNGRLFDVRLTPDAQGRVGLAPTGAVLPLGAHDVIEATWLPVEVLVKTVDLLRDSAGGSRLPNGSVITSLSQARAQAPPSAHAWWLFVVAESATLAWPVLVLLTACCALIAERRLSQPTESAEKAFPDR
jgi:hypothetical protein